MGVEMSKKCNFSSVCSKGGVVANFMSADPYKLPSYLAGIPNKWPGATEHLIDGNRCTCLQLKQMKAKYETLKKKVYLLHGLMPNNFVEER